MDVNTLLMKSEQIRHSRIISLDLPLQRDKVQVKRFMLLQEKQARNWQFVEILPISTCNVGCLASSHTFTIHKQITAIIRPTGGRSKMTYTSLCINFPSSFTNLFSPPGSTLMPHLSLQQLTFILN